MARVRPHGKSRGSGQSPVSTPAPLSKLAGQPHGPQHGTGGLPFCLALCRAEWHRSLTTSWWKRTQPGFEMRGPRDQSRHHMVRCRGFKCILRTRDKGPSVTWAGARAKRRLHLKADQEYGGGGAGGCYISKTTPQGSNRTAGEERHCGDRRACRKYRSGAEGREEPLRIQRHKRQKEQEKRAGCSP